MLKTNKPSNNLFGFFIWMVKTFVERNKYILIFGIFFRQLAPCLVQQNSLQLNKLLQIRWKC